jgi:hypothetical protein
MKFTVSSFLFLLLVGAIVVGCGSEGPRTSTEGASPDAIAEYEAAVAAAEGSMESAVESSTEESPTAEGESTPEEE